MKLAFWDRWDFYRRKILALQLRVKLFKSPILGTFKNKRKNFPLSFSIPPHINQYCEPYNTDFSFTRYCWKPLLKSLGIPCRKLYVMRHTYATNILKNTDISPYELSRLLGHSSTEMVFNRYVKFIKNQKDEFKRDVKIY